MPIRAISAPNIALIKYWGNRNDELRLPAADSLSMTLDGPLVEVSVDHAEHFSVRSYDQDGTERVLSDKGHKRLHKHFLRAKDYLHTTGATQIFPASVSVEIQSKIPPGVGLASSAAIFSALAESYAGFAKDTSRKEVSIIARLGSGSASRSVFGGFVAMVAGVGTDIDSSYAQQIAPQSHWKLHDIVIVPSAEEKKTGSTEGHALAHTSPLFAQRARDISMRQATCIEAIQKKDFDALRHVSEGDCLNMHKVMLSSTPSLDYLSTETHRIIGEVMELRARKNLAVLFTMDAGPTVHLICEKSALEQVRKYATAQKGCVVFETSIGGGSHLM